VKLARYIGGGQIAILEEDPPVCPPGGLLVRTEASGLCSGELMDWYMDRKIPHVLGHEVAGIVVESQDSRFPVGCRVAPHHHAPCLKCELCLRGAYVHCEQWKRTKLVPGGMAEFFAVGAENLTDTHVVTNDLGAIHAALMEPLGCVVKSLRKAGQMPPDVGERRDRVAVVGLGVMGLLHLLAMPRWVKLPKEAPSSEHVGCQRESMLPGSLIGYELNPGRREWATSIGLEARPPEDAAPADMVYVCPGTEEAMRFALSIAAPGATICLFSPLGPPGNLSLPIDEIYFRDIDLITSYSCGPEDTENALSMLRAGRIKAEQVVSHFISIDELPAAYQAMKRGEILKPMVVFD
jgi:L-iditol 2-dehydrogenase